MVGKRENFKSSDKQENQSKSNSLQIKYDEIMENSLEWTQDFLYNSKYYHNVLKIVFLSSLSLGLFSFSISTVYTLKPG